LNSAVVAVETTPLIEVPENTEKALSGFGQAEGTGSIISSFTPSAIARFGINRFIPNTPPTEPLNPLGKRKRGQTDKNDRASKRRKIGLYNNNEADYDGSSADSIDSMEIDQ
jgi:hypothetical protein